jgi:16S rRNA (guanine527-N7)-methyltransferase
MSERLPMTSRTPARNDRSSCAASADAAAAAIGGDGLPAAARQQLASYLDLLLKWNRTYNLTAIRERPRMITHHLNDALAIAPFLPAGRALRVLDIGTGAGIPGIPLAVARPDSTFVLIDASHKKIAFVTQAIVELRLRNVSAVASRVEDYVAGAPFDIVISRAFSDLPTFIRAGTPHVAGDGALLAMKGTLPADEIAAVRANGGLVTTHALDVPGLDAQRHLVVVRVGDSTAQ